MTISFSKIPQNWRLPLFFAELDPSHANSATVAQRTLIVGQMTAAGLANPAQPSLCASQGVANRKTGANSMVARCFGKYRLNDPAGEVWVLPVLDDPEAVAATGTVKFTHIVTVNGTWILYVAGQVVQVPFATTQTLAQMATGLIAAVNAIPTMPVVATIDGADDTRVILTAVNAGPIGNDITIIPNFLGSENAEVDPAGLTYVIVQPSTGAVPPDFTVAFANCVDQPFDFIIFPYTDVTSLNAMQEFLNDTTGRWSFNRQVFGGAMTAYRGTIGQLQTFGTSRNDPHTSVIGFKGSPNMLDEWAAAFFGAIAPALRNDPGRPVQFLTVQGLLAPPIPSQFADVDRNTLLYDGISTFTVNAAGQISTENIITTYQLDGAGEPDDSYLEIETLYTLALILRTLRSFVTTTWPRSKLAKDGTRFAPGLAIVTPSTIRLSLIAQYRQMNRQGIVEDPEAFAEFLLVEINGQNRNRVDVLWPGDLTGQLRMFALLGQFRLNA